jgi:hypothetical protein
MVALSNNSIILKESQIEDAGKKTLNTDISTTHLNENTKRSRIGSKLLLIENEEFDLTPRIKEDLVYEVESNINSIQVNTILEIDKKEEIITLSFNLSKSLKIKELIIQVINELNILLSNKSSRLRFNYDYSNYQLKPSKKNKRPNIDFPSLDKEMNVLETGIFKLSLIYSKSDLITIKNRTRCINCSIL